MNSRLITLSIFYILNLQYFLQATPAAANLASINEIDGEERPQILQKLKTDMEGIRWTLENLYRNGVTAEVYTNGQTEIVDSAELELQRKFDEMSNNVKDNQEYLKEIREKSNLQDTAIEKQTNTIEAINENIKNIFEKLQQTAPADNAAQLENQFELFGVYFNSIIQKKFEEQENAILSLKIQNQQNFELLQKMNEQLQAAFNSSQLQQHANKIENSFKEKHENFAVQFKDLKETFGKHFVKHDEKLEMQEKLLNEIKSQNTNLAASNSGNCEKSENVNQSIQKLNEIVHEMATNCKIRENVTAADNYRKCNDLEIEVHIVDDSFDSDFV